MPRLKDEQTPGQCFETELGKVTGRIRSTLNDLFAAFPNGIRNSRDVQKHLGVDTSLSWQVFRLLSSDDPLSASRYVPAAVSMRRVFESARDRGVTHDHVAAAEGAIADFERMVRDFAGDRTSFKSMLAGLLGPGDGTAMRQADLQNRKNVFKGHSYYWGIQTEGRYVVSTVAPSRDYPGRFDYGQVRMLHGLRRLRADAELLVDRYSLERFDIGAIQVERRPLDAEAAAACGAPLVAKLSSTPMPEFITELDETGIWRATLVSDRVGQTSRVNLTFGNLQCGAPISRSTDGTRDAIGPRARIWVPTKAFVSYVLVHRDIVAGRRVHPILRVQGHATQAIPGAIKDARGVLPFPERLEPVGTADGNAYALEMPRGQDAFRMLADAGGWALDDFDVYFAKIEYPLLDTTVSALLEIDD